MQRKTKREIVAALIKAGKRDLAEQFVMATSGCCRELKLSPRFIAWAAKAEKPADVERYYKDCMGSTGKAKGASYCAAVAWSIYCKHKQPDSPHCKQAEYFTGSSVAVASANIEKWLKAAKEQIEKITAQSDPTRAFMQQTLRWKKGPKFYRVSILRKDDEGGESAYAFIDLDGNIYKPAGWKAPAKGPRGHVDTTDVRKIDQYGSWLYRRGALLR